MTDPQDASASNLLSILNLTAIGEDKFVGAQPR